MTDISSTANWSAEELPAGTNVAGFVVERVLGHGGAATVYACHDPQLDRKVALKLMRPETAGDEAAARFDRERKAVAKVKSPHVVDVYAAGECDKGRYLVMQLLDGESLAARLKESGALAVSDAVAIALDVARGLRDAAAVGIVHRDVKPRNIILTANGAVLTDFGLARPVVQGSAAVTSAGIVMGTAHYLAPEVIRGDAPTNASDAYSLGCVLYEMLAGAPPFDMPSNAEVMAAQLQGEVPPLQQKRNDVPTALAQLVHRMLGKSATSRLHAFDEIVGELTMVHASSHDAVIAEGEKLPSFSDLPAIPELSDLAPDTAARAAVLDEALPNAPVDSWVGLPKTEATAAPTPEVTDASRAAPSSDSVASLPMVSGAVPIQSDSVKPDFAMIVARTKAALAPLAPLATRAVEKSRVVVYDLVARARTAPPKLRFATGIALAAILGFIVVALALQEDDLDRIHKGDAAAVLKERDDIPSSKRTPEDELIRGHALFALDQREAAFEAWTIAAEKNVVDDAVKAAALTRLDEVKPTSAVKLLSVWPDSSIDKELRAMTSADRFWRKHWALTILEERDATDGIDLEKIAIQMLTDGGECSERKLGAARLREHGKTQAALDAVVRARKTRGNTCLRSDLKAAESAIKERQ